MRLADTPEQLLERWVVAQSGDTAPWFRDQLKLLSQSMKERDLHIFLGLVPRRLGKADLNLTTDDLQAAENVVPGWQPEGWSIDGAARVLGLLRFKGARPFAEIFKDLRRTSDVAEMIALYRGLPLYPEPDAMNFEVGEGLRSNLKPVFEAIAHRNPFPRDVFDQHRWNHMILKALFVEVDLAPITGLKDRANPELARILMDFAKERWAAGRPLAKEHWIPVAPYRHDPAIKGELDQAIAEGRLTEEALL
jgi:hypothetical protein